MDHERTSTSKMLFVMVFCMVKFPTNNILVFVFIRDPKEELNEPKTMIPLTHHSNNKNKIAEMIFLVKNMFFPELWNRKWDFFVFIRRKRNMGIQTVLLSWKFKLLWSAIQQHVKNITESYFIWKNEKEEEKSVIQNAHMQKYTANTQRECHVVENEYGKVFIFFL